MLEIIKSSMQSAYMRLPILHIKPLWLLNIHLLLYNSIEEGSLDVHLMDIPTHLRC